MVDEKTGAGTPLRVGIVANEFFDPKIGRVGGFGWAANKAADVLMNHPKSNAEVSYITAEIMNGCSSNGSALSDISLITLTGNRLQKIAKMLFRRIDILLTIDYRSNYRGVFNALPFTPIITWVRDPRTPDDVKKIETLKIPGKEYVVPAGISVHNTQDLSAYRERPFPLKNRVTLANKMPHMKETNFEVYDVPGSEMILPNPNVVDYGSVKVKKDETPTIVYIGRLDPIKRPWLFIELAKEFPKANFLMLGKNHFTGEDGWRVGDLPYNVKLLGHITGDEKFRILSSAWVLINTSIHEESPVSVLEALAYEVPLLSYEDWGNLVSRHGIAIGQHPGTGMDGLPALADALKLLLENKDLREEYGKTGRAYVEKEHNDEVFLSSFREICLKSGITKAAKSITV